MAYPLQRQVHQPTSKSIVTQVYVIQEAGGSHYRVGICEDPELALHELNKGNPRQLGIVFTIEGSIPVRDYLLHELSDDASRWFETTRERLEDVLALFVPQTGVAISHVGIEEVICAEDDPRWKALFSALWWTSGSVWDVLTLSRDAMIKTGSGLGFSRRSLESDRLSFEDELVTLIPRRASEDDPCRLVETWLEASNSEWVFGDTPPAAHELENRLQALGFTNRGIKSFTRDPSDYLVSREEEWIDILRASESEMFDRDELCSMLGVSDSRIDVWLQEGLDTIDLPGSTMFEEETISTFLASRNTDTD